MYKRSDGHMTGNHQQGRHFDKLAGAASSRMKGVAKGAHGGDSATYTQHGHPQGTADIAEGAHETQPHPATGVHGLIVRHHGDGRFSVSAVHEPMQPHPQEDSASTTEHYPEHDMHQMVQTHFPGDDADATGDDGGETFSGITGEMPGQGEENPRHRGY